MKTKIKYLRQELGISQQDLAKKAGVTRQTVNALENGRYNPSLVVAYQITKILKQEYIEDVFILEEKEEKEK
ncbi:MAG: helix-turn-helix transcriptional regulator, partial [Methanobacteriaceae archaeon]|nr:helix-turn-helix transcriptional regulator [Methanobacteriaceae archaeon]